MPATLLFRGLSVAQKWVATAQQTPGQEFLQAESRLFLEEGVKQQEGASRLPYIANAPLELEEFALQIVAAQSPTGLACLSAAF